MEKILFATNNEHKVKELRELLANLGYELITNRDLANPPNVDETGQTFEENAKLKAHALADYSGLITIADDSGLMIDKLNGQPGVHSARYAGDHNDARNNAKVLTELGGVPEAERTAAFYSTIVVSCPGKFDQDLVVVGKTNGVIATIPKGDNEFGYDPLFYIPEKNKTYAEMSIAEKNEISHRGKAVREVVAKLPKWIDEVC